MPTRLTTRTETREERKRTNKFLSRHQIAIFTNALFQVDKKWFQRFFLCLGIKLEFLLLTGINNSHLYSFGDKEIADLLLVSL